MKLTKKKISSVRSVDECDKKSNYNNKACSDECQKLEQREEAIGITETLKGRQ